MPPAGNQRRRIDIVVNAGDSGPVLKQMATNLGLINKNTKDLANGFNFLQGATGAFFGGLSIREMVSFSDEIQNLNNRLLSLTGSQADATSTMDALVSVARDTNQSISSVSDSYFRMSLVLQDVGISQQTMIDTTKTIANTFRLSGASTEEARNATIQLGQAFSLGVLRGQDLRSVMSQNIVLTKLLRKEFGNDLLKAAEKGLITVPKLMKILNDNMEAVNGSAKTMSATFEQSLTKAIDALKLKIFELNQSIGASSIFAVAVQWVIDHMSKLSSILLVFGVSTLPLLAKGFFTLAGSLGLLNPGVVIITALAAALISLNPASSAALGPLDQLGRGVDDLGLSISKILVAVISVTKHIPGFLGAASRGVQLAANELLRYSQDRIDGYDRMALAAQKGFGDLHVLEQQSTDDAKRRLDDIKKLNAAFNTQLEAKTLLSNLNKEFKANTISISEYNKRILEIDLTKANQQFLDGEKNLSQLHDAERKIEIFKINRQLKDGVIGFDEYNAAIREVGLKNLNEDVQAGTISLNDYNSKLASVTDKFSTGGAFRAGLTDYVTSIGTTTQQVAGTIANAFKGLEDVFFDFTKNGKFNFDKFTQSILDDLTRIIIRSAIISPIAKGILGAFPADTPGGGAAGHTGPPANAHGNIYDHGLKKFAYGGVVTGPTGFNYGRGKSGIMGEAGPEAILPLRRGSGGDLGVQATVTPVTVNIINQSGNEVQQRETTGPNGEKAIDILITGKVKEGVASGKFDRVFNQAYGLNRKGS